MQIIIDVPPGLPESAIVEEIGNRLASYFECELLTFKQTFINGTESATPIGLLSASELEGLV